MAVLTIIGITLLCLGYLGILFLSLSTKPEQDEKNRRSMLIDKPVSLNQPKSQPSNPAKTGTPG
jgi:hypothetical protein